MFPFARFAALSFLLLLSAARAAETATQYLSGLGKDDPVQWQITCDNGQNANKWSTIGVPSNWELQGFGIYTYGRVTLRAVGLAFAAPTGGLSGRGKNRWRRIARYAV